MKKITSCLFACFLAASAAHSQGLENIIVEKYYVSNAADSAKSEGLLPVGSVTYRIFADMKPGYIFKALYGVNTPGAEHELRIATTTRFFNNTDRGATSPNGITETQAKGNTVMLDTWFSVGAAADGKMGVLKTEDTDGALVNTDTILQNADMSAGIPIKTKDGMISGTPQPVTFVGTDSLANLFFGDESNVGKLFSTNNGSVASLIGSVGPTADNKVLLGQFTTNGTFSFELNLQIRLDSTKVVEYYVAKNPMGSDERLFAACSYTSPATSTNTLPVVNITSPANSASFGTGAIVTIAATATDADGTVASVEFFVNGVSIGSDATSPYQYDWTSVAGTAVALTAVATDDKGGKTTSAAITIVVGTVGINDVNSPVSLFNVYPMPSKDFLTLEILSSEKSLANSYTVYGLNGSVLFHKELGKISGKIIENIDMSSFANGQYVIELLTDGKVSSRKIIKN